MVLDGGRSPDWGSALKRKKQPSGTRPRTCKYENNIGITAIEIEIRPAPLLRILASRTLGQRSGRKYPSRLDTRYPEAIYLKHGRL